MFSIVIPTYNRAKLVVKAIESILCQTFTDFEIIVVDDGSTDNTRGSLDRYMGKIRYHYQNNSGVSAARNKGIELAEREWVGFLDSDDIWLPDKLMAHKQFIFDNPDIILHTVNFSIERESLTSDDYYGSIGFTTEFPSDGIVEFPLALQLKYSIAWLQSSVVRKKIIIESGMLDTSLDVYEDFDLFCRLATRGKWGVCQTPLAKIFRHENEKNQSALRVERPVEIAEGMVRILENIAKNDRLSKKEQRLLATKKRNAMKNYANLLSKMSQASKARGVYTELLKEKLDLKVLLKYLFCTGR